MAEQNNGNLPERDPDTGRFASTELTRKRDAAIGQLENGGDTVYAMVAAGLSASEIAEELGLDGNKPVVRQSIYTWLQRNDEKYEEAKRISAEAHAELAGEAYGDTVPATSAEAKWRNDRSNWHRWMAEQRSPDFGRGDGLQVSIGELHLSALRQAGSMEKAEREREAIDADYRMVNEEEDAGSEVERPPNEEEPVRRELGERPNRTACVYQ